MNSADFTRFREASATLRRFAELLARYGVKGSISVHEALAREMSRHTPETVETLKRLGITVGYIRDVRSPHPTPPEAVLDMDWDEAVREAFFRDTHETDPFTGEVDPEKSGGWRTIEEVFGGPSGMSNRTYAIVDSRIIFVASVLYARKKLGIRSFVGLDDALGIGSDAFWYMGVAGIPTTVFLHPWFLSRQLPLYRTMMNEGIVPRIDSSIEALKVLMNYLPDGFNLITLGLHTSDFFQGRSEEEREGMWRILEELVAFAARHPLVNVVTTQDILNMIIDDREKKLSMNEISKAVDFILRSINWARSGTGRTTEIRLPTGQTRAKTLPDYIDLGDDYLSLADAFQALVYSLAYYAERKALPEMVEIKEILGPTATVDEILPHPIPRTYGQLVQGYYKSMETGFSPVIINGEDIFSAATSMTSEMADRVPIKVKLPSEGRVMNSAEFLILMAQEFYSIRNKGEVAPVIWTPILPLPKQAERLIPFMRSLYKQEVYSILQLWTLKPLRWKTS